MRQGLDLKLATCHLLLLLLLLVLCLCFSVAFAFRWMLGRRMFVIILHCSSVSQLVVVLFGLSVSENESIRQSISVSVAHL